VVFASSNDGRGRGGVRYGTSVACEFGLVRRSTARVQAQLYDLTLGRNIVDRVYAPQAGESVEVITRRGLPLIPLFEFMIRF